MGVIDLAVPGPGFTARPHACRARLRAAVRGVRASGTGRFRPAAGHEEARAAPAGPRPAAPVR
ncbi:hypothetical protein [Streptomyces genisteinicus]|uniref:Uncharacterized protein n=1 Tax=Streptomyces genisteinicus TaxID=2768068 RepID=A0A7H0I077_9ACTN|nr:hypothetical protein [Streptomyces genisteinicus]QNP66193.1 hypothetical protein IAG43_26860 [Streptomyces genisteinicus]